MTRRITDTRGVPVSGEDTPHPTRADNASQGRRGPYVVVSMFGPSTASLRNAQDVSLTWTTPDSHGDSAIAKFA